MTEPFEDDFRALDLVRLLNQANGEGATLTTLRDLVEMACEHGACRALRRCGLEDHGAGQDIAELRNLLEAWRDTRQTMRRTLVKWITSLIISLLLLGLAIRLRLLPIV